MVIQLINRCLAQRCVIKLSFEPPLNEVPADPFVKASVYLRDVCVHIYIYMYFDIGVVSFICF